MKLNITQMLTSLSFALDYLEIDMRKNVSNHNKRLAYIAGALGRYFELEETELSDLYAYALLHDNGISSAHFYMEGIVPQDAVKQVHCIAGEKNLSTFPFFEKRENVIKYHHEHYDGTGVFGAQGDEIPIFSQIIHLADMIETLYSTEQDAEQISEAIHAMEENVFSKVMVKAFDAIAAEKNIWMNMDNMFLDRVYLKTMPAAQISNSYKEIIDVCQVYVHIVDGKSPFTVMHSQGLANKVALLCNYYGFNEEKSDKMYIAAQLHDLGRLIIPSSILDKPDKLTSEEYSQVKYHTFYTRKALETIEGFEDITEWASNHHERLDGRGYPLGLTAEQLCFESRIMACLDIYQALTEDRPYRDGKSHGEAIRIMEEMAENGEIQQSIVGDIKDIFDEDYSQEDEQ